MHLMAVAMGPLCDCFNAPSSSHTLLSRRVSEGFATEKHIAKYTFIPVSERSKTETTAEELHHSNVVASAEENSGQQQEHFSVEEVVLSDLLSKSDAAAWDQLRERQV